VSRVAWSPVPGFVPAPISSWRRRASPSSWARCATRARTFTAYDTKGRATERATFPASFATATTRPALSNATKVVSTKWHASFNLPTQVAEPNKLTTNTYNAKGMLTGTSWTATTDATGAAKFNALKSGSTYATGWGYNANSLATSIVTRETAAGATVAVETQRYTMAYATNGDMTRLTDVTNGNQVAQANSYDAHGRVLSAKELSGRSVAMTYTLRGLLATEAYGGAAPTTHQYNSIGMRTKTTTVHGDVTEYFYDAAQRVVDVKHNGVSLSDPNIGASAPPNIFRTFFAKLGSMFVSDAKAQGVVVPCRGCITPAPPLAPGVLGPGRVDDLMQNGVGSRSRNACARSRDRECGRCDPQDPDHRGRIQAQDNPPTPYEDSVPWAQCEPYTYAEAVMAVDVLMARMPATQALKYRTSPAKMKRYFYEKSLEGGVSAFDSKSFRDNGQPNARIDAEVRKGKAYVP
jgi:YD repeat-containing protein